MIYALAARVPRQVKRRRTGRPSGGPGRQRLRWARPMGAAGALLATALGTPWAQAKNKSAGSSEAQPKAGTARQSPPTKPPEKPRQAKPRQASKGKPARPARQAKREEAKKRAGAPERARAAKGAASSGGEPPERKPPAAQAPDPPPKVQTIPPTKALKLVVRITGLRNERGRLAVALFDGEAGFPKQQHAIEGQVVPIQQRSGTATFNGLGPGRYAVAVLHDENNNDKMDFSWIGVPQEGFGFSRDARVVLGPPDFEDAAVRVSSSSRIWIKARYFDW